MIEQIPTDGGPVYAETNLNSLIVEPWNALSSLAIVLPALYWAVRLKGQFRKYSFMYYCIPLLFLGGLGSTLFHAFRSSEWFLLMDVLPTALLTLSVSIFLWIKILPRWWWVCPVVLPLFGTRILIYEWIDPPASINLDYFVSGAMIFTPLIIYLWQTKGFGMRDILLSVLMLALALVFRERDYSLAAWLPMGSHFLWHIFSGIGAYFLGSYLFRLRSSRQAAIS